MGAEWRPQAGIGVPASMDRMGRLESEWPDERQGHKWGWPECREHGLGAGLRAGAGQRAEDSCIQGACDSLGTARATEGVMCGVRV